MYTDVARVALGVSSAILGGLFWWHKEEHNGPFSPWNMLGVFLVVMGALSILFGIKGIIDGYHPRVIRTAGPYGLLQKALPIIMIFVGSVSYTIAAYYHLRMKRWSFLQAFMIAVPFILVEYQFSLRGNHYASTILGMNAIQITLVTMAFYFVNSWLLNHFVLKNPVVWWREVLAFAFIIAAFLLSTAVKN